MNNGIKNYNAKENSHQTDPKYVQDLSEAFEVFSKGAEKMKQMYDILEKRVVYLTEELEKKNKELERANRLASLGELAAGVAHEIRNPLGGIELCATMLQRELSTDASKQDLVTNIVEGTRRLNSIVKNLLAFTKDNKLMLRDIAVNTLIEESIASVRSKANRNNVQIIKEGSLLKDVVLKLDPDQLRQVFINIILNAVEAMADGGILTVDLSARKNENNDFLVISFKDTGKGIDENILDKIFQPFFTTKEEGTGLGLAISHKIVERHNGKITVESKKGEGAVFNIFLPFKN